LSFLDSHFSLISTKEGFTAMTPRSRQDRQGSQKARLKEIQFNAVAYSFFETWRDLGVIAVNPSLVEINEK
jgi:hypothetical protein